MGASNRKMLTDREKGSIIGLLLGDVLGMPHEFSRKKYQGLTEYSDRIVTTTYNNQYQGQRTTALGQGSDDSEMAFAMLDSIIRNNGEYKRDDVIMNYMKFANSSSFTGKNTANLLKGVTTLKGYQSRCSKVFGENLEASSQSNGSLMRIVPIVLMDVSDEEFAQLVKFDTSITNPNSVNYAFGLMYVKILRSLIQNVPVKQSIEYGVELALRYYPGTKELIESVLTNEVPDVTGDSKGWIRHTMHVSIHALMNAKNFKDDIKRVIKRGGDTDTNGAVAGAMLGAYYGLSQMMKDPVTASNITQILACDTSTGDYKRETFMSVNVLLPLLE